jgi:hypothetical protein
MSGHDPLPSTMPNLPTPAKADLRFGEIGATHPDPLVLITRHNAAVAQLVEHVIRNAKSVATLIAVTSTNH